MTTSVLRGQYKSRVLSSDFKFMLNCIVLLLLCNAYFIDHVSAVSSGGGDSFENCFQQRQFAAIGSCLGHRALSFMQRVEDSSNVTLFDGSLKISRDPKVDLGTQSRSIVNFLDLDPMDFR